MTRARFACLALGSCATAAALTTVLLAAPAHAEPIAACSTSGGFILVQGDPGFPPGLFAELDLNNDNALCVKPLKPGGFLFIDNRVRA